MSDESNIIGPDSGWRIPPPRIYCHGISLKPDLKLFIHAMDITSGAVNTIVGIGYQDAPGRYACLEFPDRIGFEQFPQRLIDSKLLFQGGHSFNTGLFATMRALFAATCLLEIKYDQVQPTILFEINIGDYQSRRKVPFSQYAHLFNVKV